MSALVTEAWPGEMVAGRTLIGALRSAMLAHDNPALGCRLLRAHATWESRAREGLEPADFFEPGHTYTATKHADLIFECLALSADPDTGEQQAIGWRYGPPHNGVRRHQLAALGPDDWACCDWAAATEGGDA